MRSRSTSFWVTAIVGYGVVVVLLASGMVLTRQRFDAIATAHVKRIRTEENQITIAERLRWSGEAIVSTGRGYLISGDPYFLRSLEEAQRKFDDGIRALTAGASNHKTTELVDDVERDATAFRRHQEVLVASIDGANAATLARRFEVELVPLQRNLGASLDRLIDYKETAIDEVYLRVARERARLRNRLNVMLGVLVIASVGVAAYIARMLGRSYSKEEHALETSRRAVAARDEIMGMVAHDLRNPLSSISMRAALLRQHAENATTKRHAEGIETVTLRMASLIQGMLDVATIESGHFTVSPEPCVVNELIDTTVDMFIGIAEAKQLRLDHPPIPPELVVRADRDRVLQVLQNLVGNAIKFAPQGGRVVIEAERERDDVKFRVSDNGPGIAAEHLASVFDRFWKHEAGGKKGTGLGLFIAKGIVEAHGGRIWVESGAGNGATFCFTLPAVREALAGAAIVRDSAKSEQS